MIGNTLKKEVEAETVLVANLKEKTDDKVEESDVFPARVITRVMALREEENVNV